MPDIAEFEQLAKRFGKEVERVAYLERRLAAALKARRGESEEVFVARNGTLFCPANGRICYCTGACHETARAAFRATKR